MASRTNFLVGCTTKAGECRVSCRILRDAAAGWGSACGCQRSVTALLVKAFGAEKGVMDARDVGKSKDTAPTEVDQIHNPLVRGDLQQHGEADGGQLRHGVGLAPPAWTKVPKSRAE